MTKRNLILIFILAISYIGMATYLSFSYPEQRNVLFQSTFGIVLIGAAIIGTHLDRGVRKKKGIIRWLKIFFASYAMVFAVWLLGSVLLLPVVGYKSFFLLENPAFPYIMLAAMILALPIIAKKLK